MASKSSLMFNIYQYLIGSFWSFCCYLPVSEQFNNNLESELKIHFPQSGGNMNLYLFLF